MRRLCFILWSVGWVVGPAVLSAAVTVSPTSVTVMPGDTSSPISVELTFPRPTGSGTAPVGVTLPAALVGNTTTVPTPITYPFIVGVPTARTSLRVVTTAGTPVGSHAITLTDLTLGAGSAMLTLIVAGPPPPPPPPPQPPPPPPPGFDFSLTPPTLELIAGGESRDAMVDPRTDPGFSVPIRFDLVGFPSTVSAVAPATSGPAGYPTVGLTLRASAIALPGLYRGFVRGTAAGVRIDHDLRVLVRAAPTFSFAVSPNPLQLRVDGEPGTALVSTAPEAGFVIPITYSFVGLPAFVDTGGSRVASAPGFGPLSFAFKLLPGALPGVYSATLRASAGGSSRDLPFSVVVLPPVPVIHQVSPARVVAGGRRSVRLLGDHFEAGAQVTASRPGVVVESARVLSDRVAEISLIVPPRTPAGRVELELTNPGGEATHPGGALLIYSADSPAAPLGVQSVAASRRVQGCRWPRTRRCSRAACS